MRTRVLLAGGLLLALLAATITGAAAARTTKGKSAKAGSAQIDLATYNAKRWIVQLDGKPLARYPRVKRGLTFAGMSRPAKIDLKAAVNRRYLNRLARTQFSFAARLRNAIRGVRVERSFRVVLNGMAVRMTKAQAAKVRRMKGVRAVTPDIPYHMNMYATPAQIGAPDLWAQLGGQSSAGSGIKVGVIDSGIYFTKDAAGNYTGNPCFNDAGYTMPRGYPKGDTRFTNKKVIVARAYFRPSDPPAAGNDTPVQGPGGSPHGTHTAGTVGCNAGTTALGSLKISGIAPHAYLMNYRIFYPSNSPDAFENGNGWVVEIVKAIEDSVRDGADVISNSWGSSHQNTLDWPDPMVQAAEAAWDAGVVGVFAEGNGGPATETGNLPAASLKTIAVGAVTKYATIIQGTVNVTAPTPVAANLQNLDWAPAAFGAAVTGRVGPAAYIPAEVALPAGGPNGCTAFPAGSMTGKIAVIQRGVCEFSTKVLNAQNAGAVGAVVYNSTAGGDALQTMGAGVVAGSVTIPSVFMRRSDGLRIIANYTANPTTAQLEFLYNPHQGLNPGDVMAGFSSRGPTQDKLLKPDVVAPGVDVLSSGYGSGPFPGPFTGFGSASGTSMATPHVAGAAALLLQLHPWWTPAMVKSALMTTATEDVFTTTARTTRAGVLDRGAGRIDLTQAGSPGLVVDKPSLSGGEMAAGQSKTFKVHAWNIGGSNDTWDVSTLETGTAAETANFNITAGTSALSLRAWHFGSIPVTVQSVAGAVAGSYEGSVVLASRATGKRLHIPVWLRVLAPPSTDVLLVDDDASAFDPSFADYSAQYKSMLGSLGLSYDYLDFGTDAFPSALGLYKYRSIVVFTGDNDSFNTSGFFSTDHDALAEWLDSGGRLWAVGKNFALTEDSGSYHSRLDRGRITSGYLGLAFESDSVYPGAAPVPTANGAGPFAGMTLGLNQSSIDAYSPSPNTDTYNAPQTMTAFFRQIGGTAPAGSAISFGRSSDPTLREERQEYRYRSVSMGFGIEGLTGGVTAAQLGDRTMDWLMDKLTVSLGSVTTGHDKRVTLTANALSSVGAAITKYRWDFDDGSRYETTTGRSVNHKFHGHGPFDVRIEATDSLGHTSVGHGVVNVKKDKHDHDD
jgi:minor extracellular serine protease Vpr